MDRKFRDLADSYLGLRVSDGGSVFIAGFISLYIFQVLLIVIASLAGINIETPPLWFNYLTMVVNQGALVLAVFAYGKVVGRPMFRTCRIDRKLSLSQGLLLPVITVVCIMAFYPIAEGFVQLVALIKGETVGVNISVGSEWWEIILSIIFIAVLPAIGEEILFRGSVARGLKSKSYMFSVIISGLLFSLFHGQAAQTVHQFLIGMVFAYVYFVSGSLLASMIVHFCNNAITIILDVILRTYLPEDPAINILIPVYVAMSVVGFVLLYFLLRAFMSVSKKEANIIEVDKEKYAWAKDIARAFYPSGIAHNWNKLNDDMRMLYNDPTDSVQDAESEAEQTVADNLSPELKEMLEKSNAKIQAKRNKYDWISLAVAFGLSGIIWIINLIG